MKESTGHDWYHFERVWKMAKFLQKKEGGDLFVIELAALLHDLDDWKFSNSSDSKEKARKLLEENGVGEEVTQQVVQIIKQVSFKGEGENDEVGSIETAIVQDADRLDVIGAIGIGRAFSFGGKINRPMYDPKIKPVKNKTFVEYKKLHDTSINHFYEKLLVLKNRLKTKTAKKIAESRHKFVEDFLKQFLKEWDLKDLDEI
ncbi:HD domain-containing protein [Patescibacteria group bacterium]